MPKDLRTTPDLNVSMTRPVVNAIVKDLMKLTGISPGVMIVYPDEIEANRQSGSTLTPEEENNFRQKPRIEVTAIEKPEETRLASSAPFYPEHQSTFSVPELGVSISPVYQRTSLEITISYRVRDKTTAQRWATDFTTRVMGGRQTNVHSLDYSYAIPPNFLSTLQMVYDLMQKQAPYTDERSSTFELWFKSHLDPKATVVTDQAGNNAAWVIAERQIEVEGWFDSGIQEEPVRETDPVTWVASFTYKVEYDRPTSQIIQYPLVIHNQVIKREWRNAPGPVDTLKRPWTAGNLSGILRKFRAQFQAITLPGPGVSIPSWDEFYTEESLPDTVNIFTALTLISPTDKRSLMRFDQLGGKNLDPDILAFLMTSESNYLFKPLYSVFVLTVYDGNDMCTHDRFTCYENGLVTSLADMDLRGTYHIRLSLNLSWDKLMPAAVERLRRHPKVVIKLLEYCGYALSDINNGGVCNCGQILDISRLRDMPIIPLTTIDKIISLISKGRSRQRNRFITVGTFFISTHLKTEATPVPADAC